MISETLNKLKSKWSMDHISQQVLKNVSLWLEQFREEDRQGALKVLEKLDYVSHFDISHFLREIHELLINNYNERQILIVPVTQVKMLNGKWGTTNENIKSGHIMQMLYLMNNAEMFEFKENVESPFKATTKNLYKTADCIVFVDDFVGTGKTVKTFIEAFKSYHKIKEEAETFLVVYGIMEEAGIILEPYFTKILFRERYPKLFQNQEIWQSDDPEQVKLAIKKYEHGFDQKRVGDQFDYLFGYKQTEASIFFEHNAPNNNLSSLWMDKFNNEIGKNWFPILKRYRKNKSFYYKTIIESYRVKTLMASEYVKSRG